MIRSGNDAICVDMVEGEYPIRTMLISVGFRRPLGVGAGSLALITFDRDEDIDRVLDENAPRFSQYEQLDGARIRAMAAKARKQGYVHSDALFHKDAVSVGVPVFDQGGRGHLRHYRLGHTFAHGSRQAGVHLRVGAQAHQAGGHRPVPERRRGGRGGLRPCAAAYAFPGILSAKGQALPLSSVLTSSGEMGRLK